MTARRISQDDIQVGEPLPWNAFNAQGQLLLRRGLVIDSYAQVERLLETGLYVESMAETPGSARANNVVEKPTVVSMLLQARRKLERACADLCTGQEIDFPATVLQIRALVREACAQNQPLALAMILMDNSGRYSTRHMVDVATICEIMSQSIGVAEREREDIVASALTMNIAMLMLQDRLQEQTFALNHKQREMIRVHPAEGKAMLERAGVSAPLWLRAVAEHHEARDGSGYPLRKKGDDVCLAARMLSLADVYCARISTHAYRAAALSSSALRELFVSQKEIDACELANHLVKIVGVFPPGSCVELQNGEIALVVRRGEKANTPEVASLIGSRGEPYANPLFRDTRHASFAVRRAMPPVKLVSGMKLSTLWGKDAIY